MKFILYLASSLIRFATLCLSSGRKSFKEAFCNLRILFSAKLCHIYNKRQLNYLDRFSCKSYCYVYGYNVFLSYWWNDFICVELISFVNIRKWNSLQTHSNCELIYLSDIANIYFEHHVLMMMQIHTYNKENTLFS
jgi:hypothetical protein